MRTFDTSFVSSTRARGGNALLAGEFALQSASSTAFSGSLPDTNPRGFAISFVAYAILIPPVVASRRAGREVGRIEADDSRTRNGKRDTRDARSPLAGRKGHLESGIRKACRREPRLRLELGKRNSAARQSPYSHGKLAGNNRRFPDRRRE